MEHVHGVHQVCKRRLDVKEREKKIYQEKWEKTENAESVVACRPEVCGKILRDLVVEGSVVADAVVQRRFFARKRKRKKKQ